MGFFNKIKEGLKKTRSSIAAGVTNIVNSFTRIDEDLFEELEEILVMSDIGVTTSGEICELLRKKIKENGITDPAEIKIDNEKAEKWLKNGATPTATAKAVLVKAGAIKNNK